MSSTYPKFVIILTSSGTGARLYLQSIPQNLVVGLTSVKSMAAVFDDVEMASMVCAVASASINNQFYVSHK